MFILCLCTILPATATRWKNQLQLINIISYHMIECQSSDGVLIPVMIWTGYDILSASNVTLSLLSRVRRCEIYTSSYKVGNALESDIVARSRYHCRGGNATIHLCVCVFFFPTLYKRHDFREGGDFLLNISCVLVFYTNFVCSGSHSQKNPA